MSEKGKRFINRIQNIQTLLTSNDPVSYDQIADAFRFLKTQYGNDKHDHDHDDDRHDNVCDDKDYDDNNCDDTNDLNNKCALSKQTSDATDNERASIGIDNKCKLNCDCEICHSVARHHRCHEIPDLIQFNADDVNVTKNNSNSMEEVRRTISLTGNMRAPFSVTVEYVQKKSSDI